MTGSGSQTWPLDEHGIWLDVPATVRADNERILFLDRDGVLIADRGFVGRPEEVELIPGVAALVAAANRAGIAVAVVTNQSGIDRGFFGWDGFVAVQAEIGRRLASAGGRIDAVAACPFHPDVTPRFGPAHARWRKPGPGMIETLCRKLHGRPDRSWLVGDAGRDIEAAAAAGLAGAILIGDAQDMPTTPAGFTAYAAHDPDDARRQLVAAGFLPA